MPRFGPEITQQDANAPGHELKPDFEQLPAKTFIASDGTVGKGQSVVSHCSIVGHVAKALIARYPEALRNKLFPAGSDLVAAAHDVGKVSPFFYEKLRRNINASDSDLAAINSVPDPSLEKEWGGHAGVSQASAAFSGAPPYIPEILGQHHGFSPVLGGKTATCEVFGAQLWNAERVRLFEHLKSVLGTDWPAITTIATARLLAGLTTVSDWIGSGEFFEDPNQPWIDRIDQGLDAAGFISPNYRNSMTFRDVFGFEPRASQAALIDQVQGPGVYVLEAPMGIGKTEAALYAAYQMLSSGQASGIYFALPTQLTSNKIYDRFNEFLGTILCGSTTHRSMLLHGGAHLLEASELGEEGKPGGSWFQQSKRGILAPFAVGTLDQALMAAMNVKHGFVRAFGLAGKVVILDEIHTYDSYTGAIVDETIDLLRSLECTVIILSATLSKERRSELVGCSSQSDEYPLITSSPNNGSLREVGLQSSEPKMVSVQCGIADDKAINETIIRAEQGQQVLWIENTVAEAQDAFLKLAALTDGLDVECGVLHSRLMPSDRQTVEDRWVHLYGKDSRCARSETGRILIGTQVLEQSIDIDADFLVSRFCPSDMLLQRLGRLWRHKETIRPSGASCDAWIMSPAFESALENPEQQFGRSAFVYSPYVLCRSLEVIQARSSIALPQDIREIIEATYASRPEADTMARLLHELDHGTRFRKGRIALKQLAKVTLSQMGLTLPESKAQTRYSDMETADVLLVANVAVDAQSEATILSLVDGQTLTLPHRRHARSKREWRLLASTLARQVIRIPVHNAPDPIDINTAMGMGLQNCFFMNPQEHDKCPIRIGVVQPDGSISGLHGNTPNAKYRLGFSRHIGYQVTKTKDNS